MGRSSAGADVAEMPEVDEVEDEPGLPASDEPVNLNVRAHNVAIGMPVWMELTSPRFSNRGPE